MTMKTILSVIILSLFVNVSYAHSTDNNEDVEKRNETNIKNDIGQTLRIDIAKGKITPEQARERYTAWAERETRTPRVGKDRRHPTDKMRGTQSDVKTYKSWRQHCDNRGGQRERVEGTNQRKHERFGRDRRNFRQHEWQSKGDFRRDSRNSRQHKWRSGNDSRRDSIRSRRTQSQHRPDSEQNRGLRKEHQGTCELCGKSIIINKVVNKENLNVR